jgi:hypothetical protein
MELEKRKHTPLSFNPLFLVQTRVFAVSRSLEDCNHSLRQLHEDNFLKSLIMSVNRMEIKSETSKYTHFLMRRRQGRYRYSIEGYLNKLDETTTEVRMEARVPVWIYLGGIIFIPVLFTSVQRRGDVLPPEIVLPITLVFFSLAIVFHYYAHKDMLKTIEEILA